MVTEGVVTYESLGYVNANGQVFAWKLDEHLICKRFWGEALETAQRAQRSRRRR